MLGCPTFNSKMYIYIYLYSYMYVKNYINIGHKSKRMPTTCSRGLISRGAGAGVGVGVGVALRPFSSKDVLGELCIIDRIN